MAKFRGCYKNEYALYLMALYFKNTLCYYKGEVSDDDYFDSIVELTSEMEVETAILGVFENFNGVMVGATNFMDNVDQATLRRFTFKLQFDYLKEDGKKLFFERFFKSSLSESEAAELAAVPNLAPGDFRTVRQSMYYLGGDVTNAQRIAALAKESSLKRDTKKSGRIGF